MSALGGQRGQIETTEDKKRVASREGKRTDRKQAGGRENKGRVFFTINLQVQQRCFFQGQIHLEAPMGRKDLASLLLSAMTDS